MALTGKHISGGASIIDIGACSSRPGARPCGPEEECRRLGPVLGALKKEYPEMRISVDSSWSEVVEYTYNLIGDFIVNDISAGEDDPLMLETVGRLGLEYVAMHKRGNSLNMQQLTDYCDVTSEVRGYFDDFSLKAEANGIRNWTIDPGFGFSKTLEQNYELLRNLESLRAGEHRILVGVSRKSMIYKLLNISPDEALPATQLLHFLALQNGADILRVHDVEEAARTITLYRMMA